MVPLFGISNRALLMEDAVKGGHMPFGAVLADAEGKILAEAWWVPKRFRVWGSGFRV